MGWLAYKIILTDKCGWNWQNPLYQENLLVYLQLDYAIF